jgi:hypothetical protein
MVLERRELGSSISDPTVSICGTRPRVEMVIVILPKILEGR